MRARTLLVGAAIGILQLATPAVATHSPYYLWMGIIEINSTQQGLNVSYTYSGFGVQSNWSGSCSPTMPFGANFMTIVSCTPPNWTASDPWDVNYCAFLNVTASSSAPVGSTLSTVDGESGCSNFTATASAPAGGSNFGAASPFPQPALFPWTCKATAPPTLHPWTVRCAVHH